MNHADFDLDGDIDLLANPYGGTPAICWNDARGNFVEVTELTELGEADELLVADFNGDGRKDIAALDQSSSMSVAMECSHAGLGRQDAIELRGNYVRHLAAADWDGKPGDELIWFTERPDGIHWATFDNGRWSVKTIVVLNGSYTFHRLTVVDANGDGRQDLVLIDSGMILTQELDGSLREEPLPDEDMKIVAAGQFDEDESCDLIVSAYDEPLKILSRDSKNRWTVRGSFPSYGSFVNTQLADLDADGRVDIFLHQGGFFNMGCWGSQVGWMSASNWQVLLRRQDGWVLRESTPVEAVAYSPNAICPIDQGLYPDIVVQEDHGIGFRLIRDPFRP